MFQHVHIHASTLLSSLSLFSASTYRVLYDYAAQQDGDLELKEGDIVTLLESPLDGDWWCGKLDDERQGWFPKSYVEYIDVIGESKKRQEGDQKIIISILIL